MFKPGDMISVRYNGVTHCLGRVIRVEGRLVLHTITQSYDNDLYVPGDNYFSWLDDCELELGLCLEDDDVKA